MDVKVVLVMLAVLMPLLQASGQTVNLNINIGDNTGGSGTADKSQYSSTLAENIAELLKQGGLFQDTSQLERQLLDMTDTGQNMVITLLLDQTKKMQEQIEERDKKMREQMEERDKMQEQMEERDKAMQQQIKNLKLDLCLTKKTCCNKTLACPCGYEQFSEIPDKCYKISTDKKHYTDARSDCQAADGHLAMPKDKATNDFLAKLAKARFGNDMWIGLTDEVTDGTWVWDDGKILGTGWTNWGQPYPAHNDPLVNYAALNVGASSYEWYDLDNISGEYYICEVKATAAP